MWFCRMLDHSVLDLLRDVCLSGARQLRAISQARARDALTVFIFRLVQECIAQSLFFQLAIRFACRRQCLGALLFNCVGSCSLATLGTVVHRLFRYNTRSHRRSTGVCNCCSRCSWHISCRLFNARAFVSVRCLGRCTCCCSARSSRRCTTVCFWFFGSLSKKRQQRTLLATRHCFFFFKTTKSVQFFFT